jgi:hypothetical protein
LNGRNRLPANAANLVETVIATRRGTDPNGNSYEEAVVRTVGKSFRLEVRSSDPEDCSDADLSLQELFEYTKNTAVKQFEWTVFSAD